MPMDTDGTLKRKTASPIVSASPLVTGPYAVPVNKNSKVPLPDNISTVPEMPDAEETT